MLDVLLSGDLLSIIISLFSYLIVFVVSTPVHESAHALAAYWLGDDTAASQGRISLNPLAHFDLLGTIALFVFGIGWAKPVPVNTYRCNKVKSQKTAMALTAAAGPISNIIVAFIFMIIFKLVLLLAPATDVTRYVALVLKMVISINISLGVFNLLPIPPFDGSRLFLSFLPSKYYFGIMRYEQIIMYVVMFLLLTGVLNIPFGAISNLIYNGLDFITGFIG